MAATRAGNLLDANSKLCPTSLPYLQPISGKDLTSPGPNYEPDLGKSKLASGKFMSRELMARQYYKAENNQVLKSVNQNEERILRRPKSMGSTLIMQEETSAEDAVGTSFLHSLQYKATNTSEKNLPAIWRVPPPNKLTTSGSFVGKSSQDHRRVVTMLSNDKNYQAAAHGDAVDISKVHESQIVPHTPRSMASAKRSHKDVASAGSYRPNLKLVLGYLQKNVYDNTVPTNDDFLSVLIEKRQKAGFIVDVPEPKPGFRKKLVKLFDEVDPSPEIQVAKGLDVDHDDGSFVYALLRHRANCRARYDPYNLQVVSADDARSQPVYYCATAVGLTRVERQEGGLSPYVDRTRSLEWLWERKLFYLICDFKVFVNFRKWKAFQVWKKIIRVEKIASARLLLSRVLFTTHDVLAGCLLHIRSRCEAASSSLDGTGVGQTGISLVLLSQSSTLTLSQFEDRQLQQRQLACRQLQSLREYVVELVWKSCSTAAELEGVAREFLAASRLEQTNDTSTMTLSALLKAVKVKPTYAQIVQWRQVLKRLSHFIQLAELLILDLLRRLVRTALRSLSHCILESFDACTEKSAVQAQSGQSEFSKTKAVLFVQLNLNSNTITESAASSRRDVKFVEDKTAGPSGENDCDGADETDTDDEGASSRFSLILTPTTSELTTAFQQIEFGFQETVRSVEALVKSPLLSVFCMPLKSGAVSNQRRATVDTSADDEVGNDEALSNFSAASGGESDADDGDVTGTLDVGILSLREWPDTNVLFEQDVEYCAMRKRLMNCVDSNVAMLANYCREFDKYVKMVEKAYNLDVEASMSRKPWTPDTFHRMLTVHTDHLNQLSQMPINARLGMIRVQSDSFQRACLPLPRNVVRLISMRLPVIAGQRNKFLSSSIKEASYKLEQYPSTIDEFVEHLVYLEKVSTEIPNMETEYGMITRLYAIAKDFDVSVPPEDLALFQILPPSLQHLKTTVLHAEVKKENNVRKFVKELHSFVDDVKRKLFELKNSIADPAFLSADSQPSVVLQRLAWLTESVTKLLNKARKYANYQQRFGVASKSSAKKRAPLEHWEQNGRQDELAYSREVSAELTEMEASLTLRRMLWESHVEWDQIANAWLLTSFESLDIENLQTVVHRFVQSIYVLEKGLPHNAVVSGLKQRVNEFQSILPVVVSLRNPSLKDRHWRKIETIIDKTIVSNTTLTLADLINAKIMRHHDKIHEISATASNEAMLDKMLQKITDVWMTTDFRLVPHSSGSVVIIAGIDDMQALLEESQITLGTIRGSRYAAPLKAAVDDWELKLAMFAKTLDVWVVCQRNWIYLEQIFNTPDIQRQLPTEYKLFEQVDSTWKDVMRRTAERPNALKAATTPGIMDMLQTASLHLEKIQKSLEDYLDTKRLVFPRFYFLSNDELLDILAQSKDFNVVQPHLVKCFSGIKSLEIKVPPRQPPTVKAMISTEGEVVQMPKNIRARGPVEQWLDAVEVGMHDTVKRHIKSGLQSWSEENLADWTLNNPGQVVLAVIQIIFCQQVANSMLGSSPADQDSPKSATALPKDPSDEASSCGRGLERFRSRMKLMLNVLVKLVSTTLKQHHRLSVNDLLTQFVHWRDVIDSLIVNNISSIHDFQWIRQLKYEWDSQTNQCLITQCSASLMYGYEYLGCSRRLVVTPLTDRCYLTLTTALKLNLGGSPAGPAGTGKTETVKDLAKALGKHCIVFNCSESLDFKMLGRFFSGLAQSGSWVCFDEFNRIDVEVLSVVAQQMNTIKLAKDQRATRFIFEGCDIKLNSSCGIFITMNPNYTGRVELPDNLKSLFRPVAMVIPDMALIAEIILFSEGFSMAKVLSTKIVNLYQLASRQLSQQHHYDFGLRAIKSVLMMAGQKKRALQHSDQKLVSAEEETLILFHALQDSNLPKFISEDVALFNSILTDLFPGVDHLQPQQATLQKAIELSLEDLGLQKVDKQLHKVFQFYGQMLVRHGVMLVGPTNGGKTTVRNVLQRALTLLPSIDTETAANAERDSSATPGVRLRKGQVDTFVVNPKCVSIGNLYGQMDPATFEWVDGLVSKVFRNFSRDRSSTKRGFAGSRQFDDQFDAASSIDDTRSVVTEIAEDVIAAVVDNTVADWQWIVFDGPVDPWWIENLNTVLDDTKVLCLANGERMLLSPSMKLIFETDDLSFASPATISRCAMVYMDPVDLGWHPFTESWVARLPSNLPQNARQHLVSLFNRTIETGLSFIRSNQSHLAINIPDHSIIQNLCYLLEAYLNHLSVHGGFGVAEKDDSTAINQGETGQARELQKNDASNLNSAQLLPVQEKKEYYLRKNPTSLLSFISKLYSFAFTWAFGATLRRAEDTKEDMVYKTSSGFSESDISAEFDNFVRNLFDMPQPFGVRFPLSNRNVFNFFIDLETGSFISWDNLVPSTDSLIMQEASVYYGDSFGLSSSSLGKDATKDGLKYNLITTVDTVRYSFLSALLLLTGHSVLLAGETGVGKTALLKHMLKRLEMPGGSSMTDSQSTVGCILNYTDKNQVLMQNIASISGSGLHSEDLTAYLDDTAGQQSRRSAGTLVSTIQFGVHTSPARVQQSLASRLVKRGSDRLIPPKGKRLITFVDDLNLPKPEEHGAQPPLEFLRQFLDLDGFHDVKKLAWTNVSDVTLVSACGVVEGGRNAISPRLLKHFCLLSLPQPSSRNLQHIYQTRLGRFFNSAEFSADVRACCSQLVAAAIAVYHRVAASLRPTPSKIHYTFNVRDLSQLIVGMMQADETVLISSDNCIQLFIHEATRVFHDRLVDGQDSSTFYKILSSILYNQFKVRSSEDQLKSDMLFFTDFADRTLLSASSPQPYKLAVNFSKLQKVLEELHLSRNIAAGQATRMVFFRETVEHVVRAARVLRQQASHLLLVGVDGTGKRAIVELAAFICNCQLYSLTMTRGYSLSDFRSDLKRVCLIAGVKGLSTVLLLTDKSIVKEIFLEDVCSLLNTGEIPDLFDAEELDGIAMDLKSSLAEAQVPETRQNVYRFFFQRVKSNLHIVLSMSPAGSTFRHRCRSNPSLISCCTIDWYHDWDTEAMVSVAEAYFHELDFLAENTPLGSNLKCRTAVAQVCVKLHESVIDASKTFRDQLRRHCYVTPSSYMELLSVYSRLQTTNGSQILRNKERLVCGLSRLTETKSLVGVMQSELVALGPEIAQKAKDTELLLSQLLKDQEAVEQVRKLVQDEELIMREEAQVVEDYAKECQRDLDSVMPILEAALESLDALDKTDIAEIRVYTHPPDTVTMVVSAVCILLQENASSWTIARQVMSDPQFLKRLIEIDKDAIPEQVFTKLKKYTSHPEFTPNKLGAVSKACRSMCMWVLAVEHYHNVFKMAQPKQKRVEDATAALQVAQRNLAYKQASLNKIEQQLQLLQDHYRNSVQQRELLLKRKELMTVRLQRAAILIAALSDEKDRWAQSVQELNVKLSSLAGDMLLSAGIVAYCGIFPATYRSRLLTHWLSLCEAHQLTVSSDFSIVKALSSTNQVLNWYSEGLPQDVHSTENAIIVQTSRRSPLFIDPQGQASVWIKQMEGSRLKLVQATDATYLRVIERAIRFGEPVLLQGIGETLDISLLPVLLHKTQERAGQRVMVFCDSEIEYNSSFRLYMTTSLSNPHFLPSVTNTVAVVNFIVTFDGLQEQLLSVVVRQEHPMLESNRIRLLNSLSSDLQMLYDLEDKTLGLLQKSEGHILDRQDLIDSLQKSQGMSGEIENRVKQSEVAEQQLNQARNKFLPVAKRGTAIYFVLSNLVNVDPMYQFSLNWFQSVFASSIRLDNGTQHQLADSSIATEDSESDSGDLKTRMTAMIDRVTNTVYRLTKIGIFSRHRRMFSFTLCTSIMRSCVDDETTDERFDPISEDEWSVFLQGDKVLADFNESCDEGRPQWISSASWKLCCYLSANIRAFTGLRASVLQKPTQWNALLSSNDPYHMMSQSLPVDAADGPTVFDWTLLTSFQRLVLIRLLNPAALTTAVDFFVDDHLGKHVTGVDGADDGIRTAFEESSSKTPILFVLSPGANPVYQLMQLAKELRGSTLHVDMISLGRGQGSKAEELITKAQLLKGRWIYLQNCHLAASWMPRLLSIVDSLSKPGSDVDPNFRLWLSSKPDKCFPISVLQSSLKVTVEVPTGIKTNLLQSFTAGSSIAASYSELTSARVQPNDWRTMVFGLCLFNAVVHERRNYGQLGWNVLYDFIPSDLQVALLQLKMVANEEEGVINWSAVYYLIGDIIYGGRVSDEWDRRCLLGLLRKFLNPNILQPGFQFFDKLDLCDGGSCETLRSFLEQLPAADIQNEFSMGLSAELALLETESQRLIEDIQSGQPSLSWSAQSNNSSSNGSKSKDAVVLRAVSEIQKSIPAAVDSLAFAEKKGSTSQLISLLTITDVFNIATGNDMQFIQQLEAATSESVRKQALDVVGIVSEIRQIGHSALTTVLQHEIQSYDRLLSIIHQSLASLRMAVCGEIVMSNALEDVYNSLLKNVVPVAWTSVAYSSCKPLGSWVNDLMSRVEFIRQWSERFVAAARRSLQPFARTFVPAVNTAATAAAAPAVADLHLKSYWLSGFFFPQGFLTGVLQQYARKNGLSVDCLRMDSYISLAEASNDENAVTLHGLYIDGARWDKDNNCLSESLPGHRFSPMPFVILVPALQRDYNDVTSTSSSKDDGHSPGTVVAATAVAIDAAAAAAVVECSASYECPVYVTSKRSSNGRADSFVTSLTLNSGRENPDLWIFRGVAILCQLDD